MNKKRILLVLIFLIIIFLNKNVLIFRPLLSVISTQTTYGLVVNEKDVLRRGFITGAFNYYYKFSVNGKDYSNPSYDEKYKVGDTVLVEYNETFPFMNRIKNQK
ncbi:hypothetical protein A1704_05155 [Chryseobacterium cucumeris]|uniref:DUF3592 domain-containing protein n=1 Tax=Chryseobacterium indologenes TaxID=253 RepID=A0A411DMW3_CHRID|nr:hypothetical protein [Chryseobacterium cucumeris]KYH08055.1 hypothetical protein A1704_05155 [Chryseobacterium cucumeris]QBA21711.1 hypothetical protein EU348_11085 [Chryseobacterium indologenes]TXI98628.1 MAG: hypothetical protein E6Q35_03865 [Chryseobacterium cucumeris]